MQKLAFLLAATALVSGSNSGSLRSRLPGDENEKPLGDLASDSESEKCLQFLHDIVLKEATGFLKRNKLLEHVNEESTKISERIKQFIKAEWIHKKGGTLDINVYDDSEDDDEFKTFYKFSRDSKLVVGEYFFTQAKWLDAVNMEATRFLDLVSKSSHVQILIHSNAFNIQLAYTAFVRDNIPPLSTLAWAHDDNYDAHGKYDRSKKRVEFVESQVTHTELRRQLLDVLNSDLWHFARQASVDKNTGVRPMPAHDEEDFHWISSELLSKTS